MPQAVSESRWPDLIGWLDDGLRRGVRGCLEAEYPLSLMPRHAGRHRVVLVDGAHRAHAMYHVVSVDVRGAEIEVGLIGLVYTDPDARGRGHARACVEACIEALRAEGVPLVALWSDLEGFYEGMGFQQAGKESLWILSRARPPAASGTEEVRTTIRQEEWQALESLYADKAIKVLRPAGSLQRLAAGPAVEMRVASRDGVPVAYAALGRGDDFRDIVHEWAGCEQGVMACLTDALKERPLVGWMAGPLEERGSEMLKEAGANEHRQAFAFLRVLDAEVVFARISEGAPELGSVGVRQVGDRVVWEGARGTVEQDVADTTRLLFGGEADAPSSTHELAAALSTEECLALDKRLPWPLYLWGFDSI